MKLARFIVKYRYIFLGLFAALAVASVFFIGKTLENARFYRIITHEFPHTLRIKGDASSLTKPLSSDIFATGHRDRGKGESRVHMA